jgi:RimJ/RimL family protein N-acetyltransferase
MEGFPKTIRLEDKRDKTDMSITFRLMAAEDGSRMLAFARQLQAHDLMFLRRDITQQTSIDNWIRDIESGLMHTILAENETAQKTTVVGYSSLFRNDFDWSRHVAEIRVLVSEPMRKSGLGRALTREAFNVALVLGIQKIAARMTLDQTGARTVFEELGFRPEAVLKDEVKDREGKTHDILLMATDVETFLARGDAYGLSR